MNRTPLVSFQRGQLPRLNVTSALIDKKFGMPVRRNTTIPNPTSTVTGIDLDVGYNRKLFEETKQQQLDNLRQKKETLIKEIDVLEKEYQRLGQLNALKESTYVTIAPKPSFDLLGAPGTRGNKDGMYNCPYGLTVNSQGNVIVVDSWNSRVKMFSKSG